MTVLDPPIASPETAETFFNAPDDRELEWNARRVLIDANASLPWAVLLGCLALGVIIRMLRVLQLIDHESTPIRLAWAVLLLGTAIATLIMARSRDAVTLRHITDASVLAVATGTFIWLFPHSRGVRLADGAERFSVALVAAAAGLLVGSLIILSLARARTSMATVSFLVAGALTLLTALFFADARALGLVLAVGAWGFGVAGWNDQNPATARPPDSAVLRSPRSLVSLASAVVSLFGVQQAFQQDLWASNVPALALFALTFAAALASVFDSRRAIEEESGTRDWAAWRTEVELEEKRRDRKVALLDADAGLSEAAPVASPARWAAAMGSTELDRLAPSAVVAAQPLQSSTTTDPFVFGRRMLELPASAESAARKVATPGPSIVRAEATSDAATSQVSVPEPPTAAAPQLITVPLAATTLAGPVVGEPAPFAEQTTQSVTFSLEDVAPSLRVEEFGNTGAGKSLQLSPVAEASLIPGSPLSAIPGAEVSGHQPEVAHSNPILPVTAPAPPRTGQHLDPASMTALTAWTSRSELLAATPAFWTLIGQEERAGFTLSSVIHPQDSATVATTVANATRTGEPFTLTARHIAPDRPMMRLVGSPIDPAAAALGHLNSATYQIGFDSTGATSPLAAGRPNLQSGVRSADSSGIPAASVSSLDRLESWLADRPQIQRRVADRSFIVVCELMTSQRWEDADSATRELVVSQMTQRLNRSLRSHDFLVKVDGPWFAVVVEHAAGASEAGIARRFENALSASLTLRSETVAVDGRAAVLEVGAGLTLDETLDRMAAAIA